MPEQKPVVTDNGEAPVVEPIVEVVEQKKEEMVEAPKSDYQEELDRIEALKKTHQEELDAVEAEKKRVLTLQQNALDLEKAKTKGIREVQEEKIMKEVDRRMDLRDARSMVQGMTDDEVAQKVIMHHFENLPNELRTGSIKEQLLTAQALSLRNRLPSLLNGETMNDQANARSIASMGGGNLPGRSSFQGSGPSPVSKTTSKLLGMFAKGRANPELNKKLSERAKNMR